MNTVLLLLPAIFIVGVATSRSDAAVYRIRNKWIAVGLSYAAVAYLAAWAFYWQGGTASRAAIPLIWNFERWCVNFAVSLALAFVLWRRRLWGGGDAKLFVCYAALTPLAVYPVVFFDYYFASFFLLWCVFVPATLWFLLSLGCRELVRAWRRPEVLWAGLRDKARRLTVAGILKSAGETVWRLVVCVIFFAFFRDRAAALLGPQIGGSAFVQGLVLLAALLLLRVVTRRFSALLATTVLLAGLFATDQAARVRSLGTLKTSALTVLVFVLVVSLIQRFFKYQFDDKDDEKSFLAPWFFAGVLVVWVLKALQGLSFFIPTRGL